MFTEISPLEKVDLTLLPGMQPPDWGNILPAHEMYIQSPYCFPLKFTDKNKLLGIGTTILHNNSAWLAHIIVHPDERNKGLGQLITKTLMDEATSRNCDFISLIATDLGEPVYAKLGFTTDTTYIFFKDVKLKKPAPVTAKLVSIETRLLPALLALDKQVSGEDRTVYLTNHLQDGIIYLDNDLVEGFYLPAAGEGLIIARTKQAGIALLELRMRSKDIFVFPADNKFATKYLAQNGYQPFRTAKHMTFGKKRTWQPGSIYSRIGGNLG